MLGPPMQVGLRCGRTQGGALVVAEGLRLHGERAPALAILELPPQPAHGSIGCSRSRSCPTGECQRRISASWLMSISVSSSSCCGGWGSESCSRARGKPRRRRLRRRGCPATATSSPRLARPTDEPTLGIEVGEAAEYPFGRGKPLRIIAVPQSAPLPHARESAPCRPRRPADRQG